jgi:hypothetical protein
MRPSICFSAKQHQACENKQEWRDKKRCLRPPPEAHDKHVVRPDNELGDHRSARENNASAQPNQKDAHISPGHSSGAPFSPDLKLEADS